MAYETIVAVYDTPEHANAAVRALKAGGFHSSDISIFDRARLQEAGPTVKQGLKQAGFWRRLFGDDIRHHEADVMG